MKRSCAGASTRTWSTAPLVDAQEFPEGVDVTLVEGAVSSQEDVAKLQTIRARTQLLVALGDCAVNGQCAGDAQSRSRCSKLLQRVYVEGARCESRRPSAGRSAAAARRRGRCTNSSRWTCTCPAARRVRQAILAC